MAKKFVRGVTGVVDIEAFDKTLTNVNDLVSDGQDTYVHTKKGRTESYYKLTDSVKEVESTDSMLTITKEDGTVSIANSGLATKEELATKQDALTVGDGLELANNKIEIKPTSKDNPIDSNGLYYGNIPEDGTKNLVISLECGKSQYIQFAFRESVNNPTTPIARYRFVTDGVVGTWREAIFDRLIINDLLSLKQNSLSSNTSIAVLPDNSLRQLYIYKQTYTHTNGVLKTHVKNLSQNTQQTRVNEEFNFTVKINKNAQNIVVTLNEHDTTAFGKIMTTYGSNNTVRISGCVFTLSGSSLTIETSNNTNQNYVITFSDILD